MQPVGVTVDNYHVSKTAQARYSAAATPGVRSAAKPDLAPQILVMLEVSISGRT